MKYIKTNLHPVMMRFLKKDDYDHPAGISATGLIDSPKVFVLTQRHRDEIVIDPRMGWKANAGSAIHSWMENKSEASEETEVRLYGEINGQKVSGKFDMLKAVTNDSGLLELHDFKTTSPWTFKDDNVKVVEQYGQVLPVTKWLEQFSVYRWLLKENGIDNISSQAWVHVFILGWNRNDVKKGWMSSFYPTYDCFSGIVPLLSYSEIYDRMAKTLDVIRVCTNLLDDELPECSDKERFGSSHGRCSFTPMPSGEFQLPWCPVWRWCKQRSTDKDPVKGVIEKILEVE